MSVHKSMQEVKQAMEIFTSNPRETFMNFYGC